MPEVEALQWHYHASPGAVGELLDGGGEFVSPEHILDDLTEEQARALPPGSPYSIAQVVAHMAFWQSATLAKLTGAALERPAHLEDSFAAPAPGGWRACVETFLRGISTAKNLAATSAGRTSPDREDTSVPYDLAESALHNAYHLGQIVLLRQMQGLWPPAEGDSNDF
jgi:hypothetical protein